MSHAKVLGIGRTSTFNGPSSRVVTPAAEAPNGYGFNGPLCLGSKSHNGNMSAGTIMAKAIEIFCQLGTYPVAVTKGDLSAYSSDILTLLAGVPWRNRQFAVKTFTDISLNGDPSGFSDMAHIFPGFASACSPGIDRTLGSWWYYDLFQTANIYGVDLYTGDLDAIPWPPDDTWAAGGSFLALAIPIPHFPAEGYTAMWAERSVSVAMKITEPPTAPDPYGPQCTFFGQGEADGVSTYGTDDSGLSLLSVETYTAGFPAVNYISPSFTDPSFLPDDVEDWRDNYTGTFFGRLTYVRPES